MSKQILAVMLAMALSGSAVGVNAETMGEETDFTDKATLLCETDTVTQKDYNEGFRNYALPNATVDLAPGMRAFTGDNMANVVGVVKDYDTEGLVQGATISAGGEQVVITGTDGRFQIRNMPAGTYDWVIDAAGYCTANYSNYDIDSADGTTIFTFYIDRDSVVFQDREKIVHDNDGMQTIPPDVVDRGNFASSMMARSMSSASSVSNTVSVLYNNKTQSVDRQTYIYTVLSSELYGKSYYEGKGLQSTQISELYRAQAVAANTFLEYALSVYSNHRKTDYKVCSTSCCQVYDPTKVTETAIDATANIFYTSGGNAKTDIVMYKPSSTSYDYIWGAFCSSCGDKGTLTHSSQSALKEVSCTDIAKGAGGHRYGLCQMGAAKRAKDGNDASSILLYYYTDCAVVSCQLN